jgi:hypothetical protein
MSSRINGVLVAYAAIVSTVAAVVVFTRAPPALPEELDVKRINLREEDGTLRMVISNTERFPGLIFKGKNYPHPNRKTAGMLFFNEEGTENGGLIFSGRTVDGKVSGGGHLSFDQYEQDQVIQLTQNEHDGVRWAALVVNDRPDQPMDLEFWQTYNAMPDGPEKKAAEQKLLETFGGRQRVWVGKGRERNSAVMLSDAAGRPRLLLQVTAAGEASMQFLDENGKVVRTLSPKG